MKAEFYRIGMTIALDVIASGEYLDDLEALKKALFEQLAISCLVVDERGTLSATPAGKFIVSINRTHHT